VAWVKSCVDFVWVSCLKEINAQAAIQDNTMVHFSIAVTHKQQNFLLVILLKVSLLATVLHVLKYWITKLRMVLSIQLVHHSMEYHNSDKVLMTTIVCGCSHVHMRRISLTNVVMRGLFDNMKTGRILLLLILAKQSN